MLIKLIQKHKLIIVTLALVLSTILLKRISYSFIFPILFFLGFSNKKDITYRRGLIFLAFTIVAIGMFSYVMNNSLGRDENMYLTSSKLIASQSLYNDFAYFQMPYFPIITGNLFKLFKVTHYLLFGRIIAFAAIFSASVFIYLISFKLTGSKFVSLASMLIFSMNETIVRTCGYAWNHIIPLTFLLIALYFYLNSHVENSRYKRLFFCGFFAALAFGTKLFYISTIIPLLVFTIFYPKKLSPKNHLKTEITSFISGLFIGSFSLIYYLFRNPEIFVFNNIKYHSLNSLWYKEIGTSSLVSLKQKLLGVKALLLNHSNFFLTTITVFFIIMLLVSFTKREKPNVNLKINYIGLSASMLIFAIIIVFLPSPMQELYFILPFTLMLFLTLCFYNSIPNHCNIYFRSIFITTATIVMLSGGPRLFRYADGRTFKTESWKGIVVHQTANDIKRSIPNMKSTDRIATLSPLYAIESQTNIYNEFSTGPFLYRVGHFINNEKLARYKGTSKIHLNAFLDEQKPKAILVGHDKLVEQPFIDYANSRRYLKVTKDFDGLTLYVLNK
ncbi:MAG: glucosyltransferase domain-containing protein [Candidatus Omnitrophica bacterium]|nr:glucosyltransferase domain-containing protein [Candidatus Omnitrophota bacterium]MBU1996100.1 glucosyltransferase domain-containing protein [Candidatus Omnitrophota bacterium]MBU4334800.1 glucosyltransferase domain-containing protein [Candidatus Omnitrophota bacterium]